MCQNSILTRSLRGRELWRIESVSINCIQAHFHTSVFSHLSELALKCTRVVVVMKFPFYSHLHSFRVVFFFCTTLSCFLTRSYQVLMNWTLPSFFLLAHNVLNSSSLVGCVHFTNSWMPLHCITFHKFKSGQIIFFNFRQSSNMSLNIVRFIISSFNLLVLIMNL